MSRKTSKAENVSFDDILIAAREMREAGEDISVPKLQGVLGRGSFTTYYKHMPAVMRALDNEGYDIKVPEELTEGFKRAYLEFLEHLGAIESDAAERLKQARDELDTERAEFELEKDTLQNEHRDALTRSQELEGQAATVAEENRALVAENKLLDERAQAADRRLVDQEQGHVNEKTLLENQLETLESNRVQAQQRHEAALAQLREELEAELKQAREQVQGLGEEKGGLQATLKAANDERIRLLARVEDLEGLLSSQEEQFNEALAAQTEQARALALELREAKGTAKQLAVQAGDQEDTLETIREQLTAAKSRLGGYEAVVTLLLQLRTAWRQWLEGLDVEQGVKREQTAEIGVLLEQAVGCFEEQARKDGMEKAE